MIDRIRRVLMGEPESGTSAFLEVQEIEPRGPGPRIYDVWGYDATPTLPVAAGEPYAARSHFPPVDGLRVVVITFPPSGEAADDDPADDDPDAEDAERSRELFAAEPAGMTSYPGIPGMHRSDTIDVGFVLSGRIATIASDGARRILEPGDVYVQCGAPHSWENAADEPSTIAFVVTGVTRALVH